jgi:hypothetical protein
MFKKYMTFPLTADGDLYALQDTKGNQIAMGSREVCKTLLYLVTNSGLMDSPPRLTNSVHPRQQWGGEPAFREEPLHI